MLAFQLWRTQSNISKHLTFFLVFRNTNKILTSNSVVLTRKVLWVSENFTKPMMNVLKDKLFKMCIINSINILKLKWICQKIGYKNITMHKVNELEKVWENLRKLLSCSQEMQSLFTLMLSQLVWWFNDRAKEYTDTLPGILQ